MRERTTKLHAAAEHSGVVAALFRGQVSQPVYALYLRNLLPAYQALEQALEQHRERPELAGLAQRSLYRSDSLIADLVEMTGPAWAWSLPVLPSADRYAARITAAQGGGLLIAHCYTRYLGDLNGGQLVARRLVRQFGQGFRALAFSRFPAIEDLAAYRTAYRASLDRAGEVVGDAEAVIEEAAAAFELNIALSIEVAAFKFPAAA